MRERGQVRVREEAGRTKRGESVDEGCKKDVGASNRGRDG